MTPNDRLIQLVKIKPRTVLGNMLMRIADRELALSMMYLADCDRQLMFSRLSVEKVNRVRSELRLHARLQIRYMQYRMAIDHVIEILEGKKRIHPEKLPPSPAV